MNLLLEQPPAADKKPNWMEYVNTLARHKEDNEPFAVEEQLLQEHPPLPGELEAYKWLVQVMGDQQLRVKVDDNNDIHIVPRPEGEGGLRQD